jgi:hypothetical protein
MASRGGAPSFSSGNIWATSFARSQLNHSGKPNAAVHEGYAPSSRHERPTRLVSKARA